MAEEVRKHNKTMGETGQGMNSEEEITPNTPLARTWGEFHLIPGARIYGLMLTIFNFKSGG